MICCQTLGARKASNVPRRGSALGINEMKVRPNAQALGRTKARHYLDGGCVPSNLARSSDDGQARQALEGKSLRASERSDLKIYEK